MKKKGVPSPRPLRSSRWPDGLPNLHGVNKDRVASANALYAFCVEVMEACEKHSVLFTVENPTFFDVGDVIFRSRLGQVLLHIESRKLVIFLIPKFT